MDFLEGALRRGGERGSKDRVGGSEDMEGKGKEGEREGGGGGDGEGDSDVVGSGERGEVVEKPHSFLGGGEGVGEKRGREGREGGEGRRS